jgi:hypothetical protein
MLADKDTRRETVRSLVEWQIGLDPDLSELRRALIREFNTQADQAAAAGGIVLAISMMEGMGSPLPASMACFDFSGLVRVKEGRDPLPILAACTYPGLDSARARALAASPAPQPAPNWVPLDNHPHAGFRREEVIVAPDDSGATDQPMEQLQVTYIQYVPGVGVVRTVFSTPLVAARTEWLKMFDAITALFSSQGRFAAAEDSADDQPGRLPAAA